MSWQCHYSTLQNVWLAIAFPKLEQNTWNLKINQSKLYQFATWRLEIDWCTLTIILLSRSTLSSLLRLYSRLPSLAPLCLLYYVSTVVFPLSLHSVFSNTSLQSSSLSRSTLSSLPRLYSRLRSFAPLCLLCHVSTVVFPLSLPDQNRSVL